MEANLLLEHREPCRISHKARKGDANVMIKKLIFIVIGIVILSRVFGDDWFSNSQDIASTLWHYIEIIYTSIIALSGST